VKFSDQDRADSRRPFPDPSKIFTVTEGSQCPADIQLSRRGPGGLAGAGRPGPSDILRPPTSQKLGDGVYLFLACVTQPPFPSRLFRNYNRVVIEKGPQSKAALAEKTADPSRSQ